MLINELKNTIRNCPVCADKAGELLTSVDFLQLPGTVLPDHYDIVSCAACGFVYNDTRAPQAVFDQYYASQAKYNTPNILGAGQMSEMDRERYAKIINFVAPAITCNSPAIADIGCAQGGLLRMFKEYGYDNLFGLDPSPSNSVSLRQTGISAETGELLTFRPGRKFDVVMLTGVLEHIFDLKAAAVKLAGLLNDSGLLLIEAPDASRYLGHDNAPFYRFDFEHINHFSLPHLKNLFGRHNFELISHQVTDNKVSQDSLSPTIIAIFRKSRGEFFKPDFSLRKFILEYISESERLNYNESIDKLADSGVPILIWGLGAHAARMLKQTRLSQCNIIAFIDNDPHKTGKLLLNKPIYPSKKLSEFSAAEPVLVICSVLYSKEMLAFAKEINYIGDILCLV